MGQFVRRVHFVGIGGVGMSGIAEVLRNLGYEVSGSDLKASEITRRLERSGVRVHVGHAASHARSAQVLVVSSAVAAGNPEVLWARRRNIPVILRAQMLAELGRMKKTVTVAGSHGKTTTTAMAALAFQAAGARPTMIVGGRLKDSGSGARLGLGDFLVAEADESDGSFLYLSPLAAVVTNVDDDHLDYHGSLANLKRAFLQHLERLPFYGAAILCAEDPVLAALAGRVGRPVLTYGFGPRADWRAAELELSREGSRFLVLRQGRRDARLRLRVPGRHNVLNALGAFAAGRFLGLDAAGLARGLSEFRGVGRRLDRLGVAGGVEFIDDYGHHPTEIAATLEAISRLWKPRRLVAFFQPHRYTRTRLLARKFGPAFRAADLVLVTDIYPAGERPIPGVSSRLILDSLRRAGVPCASLSGAGQAEGLLREGDVALTLGAGDIRALGEELLRRRR
ncbi:MAG: UDP-N-acetylmuramate--L-alanine ligase [Elusimicrobia bacterium]|nr:UDP-N-acetylmuramate--L-alanine ligase [Elusimicrobiota bacterium]MDE2237492.1 UDP-N-acetylmuramate--L-alanine ligase [Elusimicrobiota bacterium]MDE2424719.1 UDP-N-acetylmuramate--L-alanine ligase [Elusimicrobiota bacterium]